MADMQITVVNMIPNAQSGESNQDSEPNLAVNPANPLQIVGSAFTPDPMGGANAPIYVSNDGGNTWLLNSIVPSQAGSVSGTGDITTRFSDTGQTLYAGILRLPGFLRLNVLRTANPFAGAPMTVLVDRNQVDQPYVQAATVPDGPDAGDDRVYVGINDFAAGTGTASIEQSLDAATAPAPAGFATSRIEARATSGQDGPPIRPAVHPDGTVYALFYGWRSVSGMLVTTDVVVVRDDNWAAGATPYTDLVDAGDGIAGVRVVQGRTVPFNNSSQPNFGQERFVGSNLSIAVDPRNSSNVYIAWADQIGTTYTLHVRRSTDRGVTWSGADLRTVANATNPALAINSRGLVGFLYQQVVGPAGSQRWVTHLECTTDDWASPANDSVLANVPAGTPAPQFLPYIGDYVHLMAVGPAFYGIFSANNTPDNANFPTGVTYQRNANFATNTLFALDGVTAVAPSIDPFFFKACEIVEEEHSVLTIAECCLEKTPPLSLRRDVLGVYADDNPQTRSLAERIDLIKHNSFARLALVTITGATPILQRDLDNANLVYQNECDSWVYPVGSITANRPDLLILNQDDCLASGHSVSADEDDLFDLGRDLGANIVAYYINGSNGTTFRGCAAHPPDRRGFWVGQTASQWTFAHELTHVVGDNGHETDTDNLMINNTGTITNPPPDLTNTQCERINDDVDMEASCI
jgi:hypothetical protein